MPGEKFTLDIRPTFVDELDKAVAYIESIAGVKVVRLIGKGGISEVYEIEDVRLGICHAVKVYSWAKDSPEIMARTDISDVLSTCDPVWMKILPGLLHSAPEGRVCLSYAVEREKLVVEEQERLQDEIDLMQSPAMKDLQAQLATPRFDSLFAILSSAGGEETDGMPSREDLEHAMLDALALAHEAFLDLKKGWRIIGAGRELAERKSCFRKRRNNNQVWWRIRYGKESQKAA